MSDAGGGAGIRKPPSPSTPSSRSTRSSIAPNSLVNVQPPLFHSTPAQSCLIVSNRVLIVSNRAVFHVLSTAKMGFSAPFLSANSSATALSWRRRELQRRRMRIFAANQSKCLSMNNLRSRTRFPKQAQSSPIKPNQGAFWTNHVHPCIPPALHLSPIAPLPRLAQRSGKSAIRNPQSAISMTPHPPFCLPPSAFWLVFASCLSPEQAYDAHCLNAVCAAFLEAEKKKSTMSPNFYLRCQSTWSGRQWSLRARPSRRVQASRSL